MLLHTVMPSDHGSNGQVSLLRMLLPIQNNMHAAARVSSVQVTCWLHVVSVRCIVPTALSSLSASSGISDVMIF